MILKSLLMNKLIFLLVLVLFSACSLLSRKGSSADSESQDITGKRKYSLTDKAGDFIVYRENGFKNGNKTFITKREVLPFDDDRSKVLEQSISISAVGKLNKKLTVMRPEKSQYTVWFDGKKYITRMSLNKATQGMEVKLSSPEKQWSGSKMHRFPDTRSVYCFYSQLVECISITGFLKKANGVSKGTMNLYVIWDGYPYFQEQYLDIPNSVFTKAKFTYDGRTKAGEARFSLRFGSQVIFYLFDKNLNFEKKYWVSQGLTMVSRKK